MSYDLHLFRPPPGVDLRAAGKHSFQHEGDGPATPESEARKQRLAAALVAHDPRLHVLPPDDGWPRDSPIPPPLELHATDGSGIHVVLFDRTAAVELPYARGETVWEQARGYLRVLEEAGGFRTWDPQTGDIVDTGAAPPSAPHAGYQRGSALAGEILRRADQPRRPWWKRW
jgi:hypothetical protein